MDDKEQIMELLHALQADVAALKAQAGQKEAGTKSVPEHDERVNTMVKTVLELREELLEMRDIMDKSVDGDKGGASQTAIPALQAKGINAPGGMSTEQLQEFKKQTLQINGLQQKMKDLEAKLTEAIANIKKGNERAGEMEEKSVENVKDLYSTIDQINNSLSEKIAQQRVEMQKIAGDTPKAINYDPFNYGEAYTGDFVDFQARKRITEIKLLLQSLQAAMNSLRESVKVSPAVDLGYKVVRLDQLLAATGFKEAIETGEASREDVVVITQPTSREPGRIEMPRKEMFQTTEDMESKWAITDSIMQTMYRLEIELGELQKLHGSSDASGYGKAFEELQQAIRQIKDRQLDVKTVKRLIDDCVLMSLPARARQPSVDFKPQREEVMSRMTLEESSRPLKNLQLVVDGLLKRLKELETNYQIRPSAAVKKMKEGDKRAACLSCDTGIDPNYVYKTSKQIPRGDLYEPSVTKNLQALVKMPARSQYVISRTYAIDTSNVTSDLYVIPRPCGASYTVYWPVMDSNTLNKPSQPEIKVSLETKRNFIRGRDGHYYIGCDVPVMKSEFQKKLPVAVLKADVHDRVCVTYKTATGSKVCRDNQYHGKQAQITTTVVKKEVRKSAVPIGMTVVGDRKESTPQEGVQKTKESVHVERAPPISERNSEYGAEAGNERPDQQQGEVNAEDQEKEPAEINAEDPDEAEVENAEENPDDKELAFDNAEFFEEENTTDNANTGLSIWKMSQNDNNNAYQRPGSFPSNTENFTNIIELMNAANAWFPKLREAGTHQTNTAVSEVDAEVSCLKNVMRLPLEEHTSFRFNDSDVRKNGSTQGKTAIQEYGPIAVKYKFDDMEACKHRKQHHEQQKQSQNLQNLLEEIPCKSSVNKQIRTLAGKNPDFYPGSIQTLQFQLKPFTNYFTEQGRQQQMLPTSYDNDVEKEIFQLRFGIQNETQSCELQQYSPCQRKEECVELPPLKHNQRIGRSRRRVCQHNSVSPRRDHSLWTNVEGSECDLLQEQVERHRKLKSIACWLNGTDNDQEDVVRVGKTKTRHLSCTA